MEKSPFYVANSCVVCQKTTTPEDDFCQTCNYPIKGTEEEQQSFMDIRTIKELDLEEQGTKIKQVSNSLKVISVLTVLMGAVGYFTTDDPDEKLILVVFNLFLAVVYFSLGLWSVQKPRTAIIIGLTIFILVTILNTVVEPASIIRGIILKIFVVVSFVKGIRAVSESEKIRKELHY